MWRAHFHTLVFALMCVGSASASAVTCRTIAGESICYSIENLNDIVILPTEDDLFGTSGGNLVTEEEYCSLSYREENGQNVPIPYDAVIRSRDNASFQGDGRYMIGGELPITLSWRGAPGDPFARVDNSDTTADASGVTSCASDNAALRVEINRTDLRSVNPGSYEAQFSVDSGQGSVQYNPRLDFNITLPHLAKVSRLNDMFLTERGNDRYRQDERFCVFVWGGGNYSISASGGPGVNDPFRLSNGSGVNPQTMNYLVRLSRTAGGGSLSSPVNPGQVVSAQGGSAQIDCGGVDNARVRVIVLDTEVNGKPDGVYRGTLYLTVEPA